MIDIVCWAMVGLALAFILFVIWTMLFSASEWDRISDEDWEEYCRRNDDGMDDSR